MSIKDDIRTLSRRAVDALRLRYAQAAFAPYAAQIDSALTRLEEMRGAFLNGSAPGSPALRSTVEQAATVAEAMTPRDASVDGACAAVHAAAAALGAARGSANFLETLRGSLRIEGAAPVVIAAQEAPVTKGNFSVQDAAPTDPVPAPAAATPVPAAVDPTYYQKLTNLFPAEALAIYGTGVGLYGRATLLVVAVGFAVLVVLRWFATQPRAGGRPQIVALAVAALSYLLWVTATDPLWLGDIVRLAAPDELRRAATLLGAAFVAVAPLLVQARSDSSG